MNKPKKLSSPDQLDRLLTVIRPPGWIALFTLILLLLATLGWAVFGTISLVANGTAVLFNPQSVELIQAQEKGTISEVTAYTGDQVKKGERLLLIGTQEIAAPADGTVLGLEVVRGEMVQAGKTLVWFERTEEVADKDIIYAFFTQESGEEILPGMAAHVQFDAVNAQKFGKLIGTVKSVLPISTKIDDPILKTLPSATLGKALSTNQATIVVLIEPTKESGTPSGFAWTLSDGPPAAVKIGSVGEVEVLLSEKRPLNYLFPLGES